MCMGCFTATEAAVIQGAAAVMFARAGLTRLNEHVTGQGALRRRRAAYAANAEFLASMGHDPEHVLGPAPEVGARSISDGAQVRRSLTTAGMLPAGAGG
ncbi:hypothetical protein G1H11_04165 [Phytoactinopolyspora alkaliphila]|uniref:Uncharacterized protein n=2 Tax=Phytoactinopolyspora alkaliphila TaxID=1783498 RepID=A0A6N9YHV0_9ACTN|nr:hypothetical protein [Phytoactinopolyspora alkaliphila]